MTKNEFLNLLREDLDGMVSQQVINENIAYYSSYFEEEMAKGRSEEDIYSELGNPSLTARTIIDANEDPADVTYEEVYTEDGQADDQGYYQDDRGYNPYGNVQVKELKWYHMVLILAVIVIIFGLIIVVGVAAITYLWPLILGLLIYSMIKRNLRR